MNKKMTTNHEAIASGKKPLEYYYNYCYSVEEGGDFI